MNAMTRTREVDTGIRQIPLAAIRLDPLAQPRPELDHDLAAEYSEAMAGGEQFPPLVVFNDRRTYWLADGFHRHEAARKAGMREVACIVKPGGLRDAILYSCSANAAHGWRRSNGDKRRAVLTLLADDEWGKWSDREIARHANVSHPLVAKLRAEIGDSSDPVTGISSSERAYTTRHGTASTMDTRRIGKSARTVVRDLEKAGAVTVARRFEPSTDGGDRPADGTLVSVSSLVAGLCAVEATPDQIVSACPDPQHRRDLAEMCSHAAELLSGVVALVSRSESLRKPSNLPRGGQPGLGR